jgi:hypothetical protein
MCAPPTLLLLGGSSTSNLLAGTFTVGGGWATTTLADQASFGPSLTTDSTGRGVGVYASTTGNTVSSTVWSGGVWGAPAPVAASAVARSTPGIDATGSATSYVIYQDTSYHYWYLAYGGTWSSPEMVGTSGNQYFGPFAATVAPLAGTTPTVSFFDGTTGMANPTNVVTTADRNGGVWDSKNAALGTTPNIVSNTNQPPYVIPTAIVTLSGGNNQLLVYVDVSTQIQYLTRSGITAWSAPLPVAGATTFTPVALAPLPGSDAILAFRGQDGKLYSTVYSFIAGTWSAVAPFSSPNVAVDTSPAVTHGIAGDTAEIAYVAAGKAYHARFSGGTWSAPVLVGGSGLTGVAIAAAP